MSNSKFISLSEFANMIGKSKQYISKLKKENKLILNEDGLVDVTKTKAKLKRLSDPSKKNNGLNNKDKEEVKEKEDIIKDVILEENEENNIYDFNLAKSKKEYYLAEKAKLDFLKEAKELIEVELVKEQFSIFASDLKSRLFSSNNSILLRIENAKTRAEKKEILDQATRNVISEVLDNIQIKLDREENDEEEE